MRIYEEGITERFLRLVYTDDGDVKLSVVDASGEVVPNGNLLDVTKDNRVFRLRGVSKKLGFQIDKNGQLVVEG